MFKAAIFICAAGALAAAADSVRLEYDVVSPEVVQQRLEMVTRKLSERRATLESLFGHAGCGPGERATVAVPGSKEPDLICTLPGENEEAPAIVVGGHFDYGERGIGAVDDWSGVVLLPSLYQSLRSKRRRHKFVFVAFAAEEKGLRGSEQFVKHLSKQDKAAIHAMVNLECLGLGPPEVWAHRADKKLVAAYLQVAASLQIPRLASNVERVGDDDSHPFLSARIPVITIHSITQETLRILHSPSDNLKAIRSGDYYTAYKLAAIYLAYLDSRLE